MRVILKLAFDAARRRLGWSFLLLFAFQLQMLPHLVLKYFPSIDALAVAMSLAAFLIVGTGTLLEDRVLFQLPLSRRQWWQARWVLGTIGVSLCAVTSVVVAAWRIDGRWPSVSGFVDYVLLTSLFCAILHTAYVRWFWSRAESPATLAAKLALTPLFVVLPAMPFFISTYLPHDLLNMDWRFSLVLTGAVMAAVPGVQYVPPITPRQWIRPRPYLNAGPAAFGSTAPSYFDRFIGLRQWLWLEARRQSILVALALMFLVVLSAMIPDPKGRSTLVLMQRMGFLPFSGARLGLGSDFVIAMSFICVQPFVRPWVANLRAVKCLPGSHWLLPALPAATGLLGGTVLGTLLLCLHFVVVQAAPAAFPAALLLEFAALIAASEMLRMTIPDTIAPPIAINMVGGMGLSMGALYLGEEGFALTERAITALSASILVLSAVVVHVSITRNPRLYRRRITAGLL